MSDKTPEINAEVLRNTSAIAAQAALRGQQMLRKSADQKAPPDVPARGGNEFGKVPPEIPPKRQSLKRMSLGDEPPNSSPPLIQRPPPPLPQKPLGSQQNSPLLLPKFGESPRQSPQLGMRGAPPTPQMSAKFEKFVPTSPQVPLKFNDKIAPIPQFAMISQSNSPQMSRVAGNPMTHSPQLGVRPMMKVPPPAAKQAASPSEDLSSEDALRGIECGLRNMERAMQEQINMRSMEAAAAAAAASHHQKLESMNFNPMEFKNMRGMGGGSITSLDGSAQNMKALESMRMAGAGSSGGIMSQNIRSMERGFSMDQMRLENLHHGGIGGGTGIVNAGSVSGLPNMRPMDSNPNIRSAIEEMKMKGLVDHSNVRPVENHMRSLDRSLPLELQYSRHRAQEVTDFRDQMRQQLGRQQQQVSSGVSREDLRMRRRSSHDENQISQGVPGNFLNLFHLHTYNH